VWFVAPGPEEVLFQRAISSIGRKNPRDEIRATTVLAARTAAHLSRDKNRRDTKAKS